MLSSVVGWFENVFEEKLVNSVVQNDEMEVHIVQDATELLKSLLKNHSKRGAYSSYYTK